MDDEQVELLLAKRKADVLEARNYVHGQPFLVGEYFDECISSCRELHEYCMDQMSEGHHHLLVQYNRDHFRHDAGSIIVSFEDLHLFFNFNVCRYSRNGGPHTCLPAARSVAKPAGRTAHLHQQGIQDPHEGPSLARQVTQDLLRSGLVRQAHEERRYQGGANLTRLS